MENLLKLGMVLLWIACSDAGQFYSHLRNGKKATVEHITQPHQRTVRNPTSPESIFEDEMDFKVTLSSGDVITLHLKLNKDQIGKVLVKVISQNGTDFFDSSKPRDFRFYQVIGDEHGASVMVRCENYKPPCYIAGSFYYNSIEYVIDPDTEIAEKVSIVTHTVYEVKPENNTHAYDHDTANVEVDDSKEENRRRLSDVLLDLFKLHRSRKTKRQTSKKYYKIELEMIVDDSIYAYWMEKMFNNEIAALEKIEQYMEQVANNMDLRFSTATTATMEIDIVPLLITVIKDKDGAGWINNNILHRESNGEETYHADKALDELNEWARTNKNPKADAVVCLSRRDMWKGGIKSGKDTAGLARSMTENRNQISTLCTENAVSINEDLRRGDTSATTSHELAHNMGVNHDYMEGCKDSDHYIMSSSSGFLSAASKAKHPWSFSICSIRKMEKLMDTVPKDSNGKTCLERHTYDVTEYNTIQTSKLLGEIYSTDEQCELLMGKGSTHCGNVGIKDEEICWRGLPCSTSGNYCNFKAPLSGSHCGNTKKCYQGQCVDVLPSTNTNTVKEPPKTPFAPSTTTPATTSLPTSTSAGGTNSVSVSQQEKLLLDATFIKCDLECNCWTSDCKLFDLVPLCKLIVSFCY